MKNKLPIGLLIIDILTIILVISVLLIDSKVIRLILGIPFLLFFPGYTLIAALFPEKQEGMPGIERATLSFISSVVIVVFIGLGLNYTPWGIKLEPVAYSISVFILVVSIFAFFRNKVSGKGFIAFTKIRLDKPVWKDSLFNKILTLILIIAVGGSIIALGYTIAKPKMGEQFTDFYLLGNNGKAEYYPSDIIFTQGKVSSVSYDKGVDFVNSNEGKVILGITNQENQETDYRVVLLVNGQVAPINLNGQSLDSLDSIVLKPGEKWEKKIGFIPQIESDYQKVEFLLYKNGSTVVENRLYLWVNVVLK